MKVLVVIGLLLLAFVLFSITWMLIEMHNAPTMEEYDNEKGDD